MGQDGHMEKQIYDYIRSIGIKLGPSQLVYIHYSSAPGSESFYTFDHWFFNKFHSAIA